MTRFLAQSLIVASLLLVPCLPVTAEVILDDHFDGATLDSTVWDISSWSTGTVSVSGSRLHLDPHAAIEAPHTDGLNYVNIGVYGVEGSVFGFGMSGAMGGWVLLAVDSDHDTTLHLNWGPTPDHPDPLHTSYGYETIALGKSANGDFEILWTPSLFQVVNNGNLLYSQDDPGSIPYYYYMGPFSVWTDPTGTVSVDRVVLTIPEPATLSLLALGVLIQGYSLARRKK